MRPVTFRLGDKTVVIRTRADLDEWTRAAKGAAGTGTLGDSRRFRRWLDMMAAEYDAADAKAAAVKAAAGSAAVLAKARHEAASVATSWSITSENGPPVRVHVPVLASYGSGQVIAQAGSLGELGALQAEIGAVAKACAASASDLPGRAARYEQAAARASDPATAAMYRQAAAEIRGNLATAPGHLAKAAEYERLASRAADPDLRRGYGELASREREAAGAGAVASGELLRKASEYERLAGVTTDPELRTGCATLAKQLRDQAAAL